MKKESILRNKEFHFIINFATALSFALFTLYQSFLILFIPENRIGRLIGVVLFLFFTVASFLVFSENGGVQIAHTVIMVATLILLFVIKMFNLPSLITSLSNPSVVPVIYLVIYSFAQLGTLILVAGYLVYRSSLELAVRRRITIVLMAIVIVLFVSNLVMECVLIIKYNALIDNSRKLTLISRFLYCFGFVGTAISFMLPSPKLEKEEKDPGEIIYSERNEDEIDLVL